MGHPRALAGTYISTNCFGHGRPAHHELRILEITVCIALQHSLVHSALVRSEFIRFRVDSSVEYIHPGRDGAQRLQECLHSAAVNGNIGLVKYPLSHGNLDGVLPLHAASSGVNYLVVKPLIEQGADVNASSAHADPADKHSVNPEMRDNGKRTFPPEPTSPFGAYAFYPTKPDNETVPNDVLAPRGPSLPHICNKLPAPSHSTSSQRSQLAGQDAEPEPPRSSTTHKLGSLNQFMKIESRNETEGSEGESECDDTPNNKEDKLVSDGAEERQSQGSKRDSTIPNDIVTSIADGRATGGEREVEG
ncbi:hypothetical protein PILCRDRAFT_4998 [Piloderma croceum F 1598]|uniref:Uncharacterized protein n=1 Tax=Piloderma croceum (strain F 1598) TaxID=765440 RepID=A0A0C3G5F5_PILCF|nr:hypothetical protein PILCRDRAFT_4998 [Piloderma croceum F 1598]